MNEAQLLSIQVGAVRQHVTTDGETWTSGYGKSPVSGRVHVGRLNIEGDAQQHKKFHGGEHRPVLMYSASHYPLWQAELGQALPYGSFAENFTVSDLDEDSVCLGDIYAVGPELRLQVSQPRKPCDQISKYLGIPGMKARVDATCRSGWYLRVLHEGYAEAGMAIQLEQRLHPEWSIRRVSTLMDQRRSRREEAHALAAITELEPSWRERLGSV